ncbi:MAG: DoxX family membrane protein [Patescibacteria group bacterium]
MSLKRFFFVLFGAFIGFPELVSAHVIYVAPEGSFSKSGTDWKFLFSSVLEWENLLVALVVLAIALTGLLIFFKSKAIGILRERFRERAVAYEELVPWMLRLGLGIALIGASTSGTLISPAFGNVSQFGFIQAILGFLILGGLITVPVLLMTILLYGAALFAADGILLGNLEFLMMGVAVLASGSSRPGIDDLLGIRSSNPAESAARHVPFLLRIGVGGAMLFSAIYEKFLHPHVSALVVEQYGLHSLIPVDPATWTLGAGVVEALIALLLIFGIATRLVSATAFFVLSLTFFYFGEAVYSHITLFASLSALIVLGGGPWSFDKEKRREYKMTPHK